MYVIGIDPSLTGTGIAWGDESEKVLTPSATTIRGQLQRMAIIASRVALRLHPGSVVVMEGPGFSRGGQKGHHALAGLWWVLAATVVGAGCTLIEIKPNVLKKFATGKGNADKDLMRAAWLERTGADVRDNDRVDALWLHQVGLHLVQAPAALDLPKDQLDAIEGLRVQLHTSG